MEEGCTPSAKGHTTGKLEDVESAKISSVQMHENITVDGSETQESQELPFKLTPHLALTVLGLGVAFTASQIVNFLFVGVISTISLDLNAGSSAIWLFLAPLVAVGASCPFIGPSADIFGIKRVTLFGTGLSVVAMILCGTTKNAAGYIAGQALAGIGLACQELMAVAAVAELVPASQRGRYMGWGLCVFLPLAPSPFFSQKIAAHNWRWSCVFVGGWNVLTFIVIGLFFKPAKIRGSPTVVGKKSLTTALKEVAKIDIFGGLLLSAGSVLFLIGLNFGGIVHPWRSAATLVPLLFGVGLLAFFVVWEFYLVKVPLFPRRMVLSKRVFVSVILIISVANLGAMSATLFWPMQTTSVYGATHTDNSLYTLPFTFCVIGGSAISSFLISIFKNHVKVVMFCCCALQAIGMGCMAAISPNNINTAWAPLILGLLGSGGTNIPNQIILTLVTPDDMVPTATALSVTIRILFLSIGVSIFQNRFLTEVTKNASQYIVPAAIRVGIFDPQAIMQLISSVTAVPLEQYVALYLPEVDSAEKYQVLLVAVRTAFSRSFQMLYYLTIPFSVVACIGCFCVGDLTRFMDDHVAMTLDDADVDGEHDK
ncbi:hypothetical protein TWF481_003654 [Arthrobotrys musiformis]|uniref:Major facilitator superfamily (MFS) profile domain-containing protein n=1 Tax=Arthrobotrys musiformis TaxID=47236 RepID=A0AAV9WH80_9PEZI